MKKQILEALKTKYKNLGFGEKAFDGVAAFLEPSVREEAEIETAISGVEGLLKAFQGDTDKLRTDKTNAEKRLAELEAKVKELGGTPDKKEPKEQDANDTPSWAKAIIDANKALTERFAALESERISATRKQSLGTILNKLPEKLRKAYERTPVNDLSDEQFEALKAEVATEVDGLLKDNQTKGVVYGRPSANNSGTKATELTKEQEAAIKQRPAVQTDGQPF